MTWIQDILDATAEVESPKSYLYWAALSAISGVVRKNVGLFKQVYTLYPNIYVLLNGESGAGKGFPIWMAKALVEKVGNTKVISGRNTIESILTKLAKAYSREGGKPLIDATAFISAGEFHSLLQRNDDAFGILTDLYDTHYNSIWENSSKGGGTETLKNVCITMIAGSNDAMLRDILPDFTMEGGFIGRMLNVSDDKSAPINPLTRPLKNPFNIDTFVPYLRTISELKGNFEYSPSGMLLYEKWYTPFKEMIRTGKDKTGIYNRLHDQVLKVAMLLSLSERLDLIITEANLDRAISDVQEMTVSLKRTTEGVGKSELAPAMRIFLGYLVNKAPSYTISKTEVLRHAWGSFDSIVLARIVDHFKEAGIIEIDIKNGATFYRLSDSKIKDYTRFQESEK